MICKLFRTLACMLLLLFTCDSFAQKFINLKTYNVDSLLLVLPDQQEEERINTLNHLAVSLSFVDYDQSMQYAAEAMDLANGLDYEVGKANAYRAYGNIYFYQGNYPMALNNFIEALTIYEDIGKKHKAAWICYDIARTHYSARNYEKTVFYGNLALEKFREQLKDGTNVGTVDDTIRMYGGLALTYGTGQLNMPHKSIEYYKTAIEISKKNNFNQPEIILLIFRAGAEFFEFGLIDSAKVYFEEILSYPEFDSCLPAIKNRTLTWLGFCFLRKGEFEKGIACLNEAYEYYEKQGYLFWSLIVSSELGKFYMKLNKWEIAEKYFKRSEVFFEEILARDSWYAHDSLKYVVNFGLEYFFPIPPRQLKEMQWTQGKALYYNLYQISAQKNLSDEALKYHVAYTKAGDTLSILQRNREIIELQTKYETERKEEQIENLSQENAFQEFKLRQSQYFLFGLGSLVILVVILAIVLIRQSKLREQQKNLLLQQKLFRSQMNPHFLFNSLSSIQNYILKESPTMASDYVGRFSKLVRQILNNSVEEWISLEDEIDSIVNYVELQKARYGDMFEYSLDVDEELDPETTQIPPMLAQPFIENSIEHGFKHKEGKGNIHIRFAMENNFIWVEVIDNGIGREKAIDILKKHHKDHRSMAMDITRERLTLLNKKHKKKITLEIIDLKDMDSKPTGTKVLLKIPVYSA